MSHSPTTYLLSTDGGKTVIALNTPLRTWFDFALLPASKIDLKPLKGTAVKKPQESVREESGAEPISGFAVRTFVIRASFTSVKITAARA